MTASTAVADGRRRAVLAPLLTLALVVLLARAASTALLAVDTPATAALITHCAATVLVAHLFHRARLAACGEARLTAWTGGLAVVAVLAGPGAGALAPPTLAALAFAVAVLVFFLDAATRCLAAAIGNEEGAVIGVTLALVAAAASPLWLGPWAERHAALVPVVVAGNPLTYLSIMASHDYLRGEWFYTHAVLGGLRYDYPARLTLSGAYLGLGVTLRLLNARLGARPGAST